MPAEDEIFLNALERTGAARAAYLDEACGDDSELRTRIERLLAMSERDRGILDESHNLRGMAMIEEKPGDVIDRFTLQRRLGEGGCGVVWLAEQTAPVRRLVAMKIIRPGMDSQAVLRRFMVEQQALALMDHAGIARVFEAGATPTGRPFFVMEYVDGVPITQYCDDRHLGLRERLELFMRVCDAIQHAHQKGVIHRDVKPSNVLVSAGTTEPVIKVIDFGIAKATEQQLGDMTLVTQTGLFLGTPAYMSPEQSQLVAGDIDTRTDVYSLGVLLYELLAGAPPFEPKALQAAGLEAMWKHIREVDPPRPSTRVQSLPPDTQRTVATRRQLEAPKLAHRMSGDLDWIVMRCLEKDRNRRYATATGLAEDIARHLADETIEARPASARYRLAKLVRRNRLVFGAGAAVVAALIAGTIVSIHQAVRANRAEQEARAEADAAIALADFLVDDMLFQSSPYGQSGEDVDPDLPVRKVLDQAAEKAGVRFAEQPLLEARLRLTIAGAYLGLGLFEQASAQYQRALELRIAWQGEGHFETLYARSGYGLCLMRLGRNEEAEAELQQVVAGFEALPPESRDSFAYDNARTTLALVFNVLGRLEEALALEKAVLASYRGRYGDRHRHTAVALANLGETYRDLARFDLAEQVLREAISIQEEVHGVGHPSVLITRNALASTLIDMGRDEDALVLQRTVYEDSRRLLGPDHHRVLDAGNNLATALYGLGRIQEAITLNEENVAVARRQLGEGHDLTLTLLNNLGTQYSMVGRLEDGLATKTALVESAKVAWGPGHPNVMIFTSNLGFDYMQMGRLDEAEALISAAVAGMIKALGAEHPHTLLVRRNLGRCWRKMGRWDDAIALSHELWEITRRTQGEDSPAAAEAGLSLALGFDESSRFEDALALWRQLWDDAVRRDGEGSSAERGLRARYAASLLDGGRWAEAEQLWSELKAQQEAEAPDEWRTFEAHSGLGAAWVGQGRLAEAEPWLISGYEGLLARQEQSAVATRRSIGEALDRLVALYEAWEKPAEVARWRAQRADWLDL
ncbi:serine/threonine-protein kinase [Actomonas aquatica]|uniref:Serine/threonine-protein kinase n=1 Tax=Actomonas aquatica TaxID=2866162 RepID=A0ABZ1C364_9BACT|nr:serine/threonine-protein kinase [Opitutus sp. WL0086]WRQ85984.1 serine/threonine-protein kinase [Opitutus sp. WL0086]